MSSPSDLPEAVRIQLDLALVDAERAFLANPPDPYHIMVFGLDGRVVEESRRRDPPRVAVDPLHEVVTAFAKVMPAVYDAVQRGTWPPTEVRRAAELIFEEIARYINRLSSSWWAGQTGFAIDASRAVRTSPAWSELLEKIGELHGAPTPRACLPVPFPHRIEWLETQIKKRAWTRGDLAVQMGSNRDTVERLFEGQKVRTDVLDRLALALGCRRIDIPTT